MDRGITFLDELQKMKKEMDRMWADLLQGGPRGRDKKTGEKDKKSPRLRKEGKGLKQKENTYRS